MSDFHENKRYLLNFNNVSAAFIVLLLMTVSYYAGYAECMKVAVETGNAKIEDNGFKWRR